MLLLEARGVFFARTYSVSGRKPPVLPVPAQVWLSLPARVFFEAMQQVRDRYALSLGSPLTGWPQAARENWGGRSGSRGRCQVI